MQQMAHVFRAPADFMERNVCLLAPRTVITVNVEFQKAHALNVGVGFMEKSV